MVKGSITFLVLILSRLRRERYLKQPHPKRQKNTTETFFTKFTRRCPGRNRQKIKSWAGLREFSNFESFTLPKRNIPKNYFSERSSKPSKNSNRSSLRCLSTNNSNSFSFLLKFPPKRLKFSSHKVLKTKYSSSKTSSIRRRKSGRWSQSSLRTKFQRSRNLEWR